MLVTNNAKLSVEIEQEDVMHFTYIYVDGNAAAEYVDDDVHGELTARAAIDRINILEDEGDGEDEGYACLGVEFTADKEIIGEDELFRDDLNTLLTMLLVNEGELGTFNENDVRDVAWAYTESGEQFEGYAKLELDFDAAAKLRNTHGQLKQDML